MTNLLDRPRGSSSFTSSGSISACEAPHSQECAAPSLSEGYFPQKFVLDPWRYPLYNRNETSKETGWWGSLLTPNGGFLKVEEPNHEIRDYGVSMFHQLHCLAIVRSVLLHGGIDATHTHTGHTPREGDDEAKERKHWLHCFDYIAQAILCAADNTLETEGKVKAPGGEVMDVISGVGSTHLCRNSTSLYDYVLQSEAVPVKAASLRSGRMLVVP
ncbi:hypothetical protein F4803DRAFT_552192 [Xylaria telfairii]|nr:hypothetical protein F4803DRAFT_552192 [Xylaria telfairii]